MYSVPMIRNQNKFSCFIIGEGTLPIRCAELLLNGGYTLYGIISSDTLIINWAKDKSIPCIKPTDNLIKILSQQPFDYLFSIVNNFVLPQEILELPRQCAINYHNAPLPRYAGVNATSWALIHQEKTHGITWHRMTDLVDAGDILKQVVIDIADDETALTLNGQCYEAAIYAFDQLIEELVFGTVITTKQNLNKRTYFSRSKKLSASGIILWQSSAHQLNALIRALDFGSYPNPLGRAKLIIDSNLFVISQLEIQGKLSECSPGTITAIEPNYLIVSTATYNIAIHQVLTINGQPLSISDLVEKFGLKVGYQFCDIKVDKARQIEKFERSIANHEAFWVEKLANLKLLVLPYTKRPLVYLDNKFYASARLSVPHEVITFLEERRPKWNWGDFLETAFVAYLARISGTRCFDIGLKDADLQQKLVGMPGLFASVIPCRVDIDCQQSFEEVFEAFNKQVEFTKLHLTYAQDVVSRYPALRSLSELISQQLFPVIIERLEKLEDYQGEPVNKFSFITLLDKKECYWFYNTDVLDEDDIARMQEQFSVFLQGLITEPDGRITHLPLLSEQEQHKILVEWNNTQADYPSDKCIHQLFEAQVEQVPDAVAVVFEEQQLTYRELNCHANKIAHHLQALGVGTEVLVGIYVERSLLMAAVILGILKAGGAFVLLDSTYPQERLAYMLNESQALLLLTQKQLVEKLPPSGAKVVCLDSISEAIAQENEKNPASKVTSDNLAYVIFTSGSTGKPKGILMTHEGVISRVDRTQKIHNLTSNDRILQLGNISFDMFVWELFIPLLTGARIVVSHPQKTSDLDYLISLINREQVTIARFVPPMLQMLLEQQEFTSCKSIRRVITGGDKLTVNLMEAFISNSNADLYNQYGPTERPSSITWRCEKRSGQTSIPIGRPLPNTEVYILDKMGNLVPIGVMGELHIGGPGLARGYLNNPDLTAKKFIRNPFNSKSGSRIYKTGDLARYLPDGNLEFVGRIDNQVKIRGFRIELEEIEAVLSQHLDLREAVVILREDQPGNSRLVAYFVPQKGQVPALSTLRSFLKQKLPDYMLPSAFVSLEAIPLTPNGKVDRHALPAPDASSLSQSMGFVPPSTSTQEVLAAIWSEVLGLERVGIYDNFFELGGHSLLATQVISRVRRAFCVELPLRRLFELPTVAKLAEQIERIHSIVKQLQANPLEMSDNREEVEL